jgi:hypothetical protein
VAGVDRRIEARGEGAFLDDQGDRSGCESLGGEVPVAGHAAEDCSLGNSRPFKPRLEPRGRAISLPGLPGRSCRAAELDHQTLWKEGHVLAKDRDEFGSAEGAGEAAPEKRPVADLAEGRVQAV